LTGSVEKPFLIEFKLQFMLPAMSGAPTELATSVVAEPDTIELFPHNSTSTSTSRNRVSDMRERKRWQNRIAQRTYRKNTLSFWLYLLG
jgi:hypothetical protein